MSTAHNEPVISVVSPVYRAEGIVDELLAQVKAQLQALGVSFEIILVDDGSPDGSWSRIEKQCHADHRIIGVQLARNFGQHAAIRAGLEASRGDWLLVMDCDLQDRPSEIPRLFKAAQSGSHDLVMARRQLRRDPFIKRIQSRIFYCLFSYLTGMAQDPSIANFGIYSRKVIQELVRMKEPVSSFSIMVRWMGFRAGFIDVEHGPRHSGVSSYDMSRLIRLALDVSVAYSDRPLRLIIKGGLLISVLSFLGAVAQILLRLFGVYQVSGFASIMVSIWLFGGLTLGVLGVLGLYVGRAYDTAKVRPNFFIQRRVN